ncbi:MAG: ParB N-terminal domain-containing protein [Asgard group archaeon]|nr:ParB N-terminal domain-containing protein [Asgard group archaeon]
MIVEEKSIKIPIGKYIVIPVSQLEPFPIREIREENVEKIKQSILEKGYNPSRVLTVIKKDEKFLVAAGNHRLQAIIELGMKAVPCLVSDGDTYSIAVRDNEDEETFAKMDLFDWLTIIKKLREEGLTQKEIGEKIGWTRGQINQYTMLLNKIDTKILDLIKQHQMGRVSDNDTMVTFSFTERWFRDSGLYDLNEKYQLDCMQRFIADKFQWSKTLLQSETTKYKRWQDFIEITREKLVDATKLELILPLIENDAFKTEGQLLTKISDLNKESKNKLICGDALVELPKLEDHSIDLVIIDSPYGVDYTSNWSKDSAYLSKKGIKNDKLQEALCLLNNALHILNDKTKANSHFYIFTSWKVYPQFEEIISKYFEIKNLIVWHKKGGFTGDLKHTWGGSFELIVFATKGNRPINKRKGDVISISKITANRTKIHSTQKPTELIKELLEVSLQAGDTVCDCFMGSGSTIKALIDYSSDCNYIGIELDKSMFEKAKAFIFGGKE